MVAPKALLCLTLGICGGIFLAGMYGGFDFTDEGFYYLSFVHPENVSDNQTSFFIFGGKLFALLGHNVVAMRFCTLLAILGGTLIFLRGFGQFMGRFSPDLLPDRERRTLVGSSALAGSFLAFAISPVALSYNFQNAFCLLAATGLLLTACARPRTEAFFDVGTCLALAGFGGLVGLEFFIKFSSSVPLAITGGLFFSLVSQQSLKQKVTSLAGLLLCLTVIALAYFTFFQNFSRWWAGTFGTADALVHGNYATVTIRRYGNEVSILLRSTLQDFKPVWAVALPTAVLVVALRRRPRWQARVAVLAGLWVLAHLIWIILARDFYFRAGPAFFIGALMLLAVLAGASFLAVSVGAGSRSAGRWQVPLAGGCFFVLPYIGALGTTNNINSNCLYQLAPWFVVAALLLAEVDRAWRTAWPSRIGLLVFAAVAGGQFYWGYGVDPYRIAGGRALQTVPTSIGEPATTLRLDSGTHEFITTARRALQQNGFKTGDDLLVLFDLPGFVFAMGGASPGHPWYFYGDQNSIDLDLMRLNFIEPERRKRAFIVRNGYFDESVPLLRAAGLNFPEGYQLITPPMKSPFTKVSFEIWQPVVRR